MSLRKYFRNWRRLLLVSVVFVVAIWLFSWIMGHREWTGFMFGSYENFRWIRGLLALTPFVLLGNLVGIPGVVFAKRWYGAVAAFSSALIILAFVPFARWWLGVWGYGLLALAGALFMLFNYWLERSKYKHLVAATLILGSSALASGFSLFWLWLLRTSV